MANGTSEPRTGSKRLRFGVFEFDTASADLRRNGDRVRLQEQPKQILLHLLEQHGEIVTREQLCNSLWPDGTFVEFDQSLNVAIAKIRAALGDSPSTPQFIETVPRKGYRFIAPVKELYARKEEYVLPRTTVITPIVTGILVCLTAGVVAASLIWMQSNAPPNLVVRPLTSLPGAEWNPSFSPDGERVAFSWNGPEGNNFDIYVKQIGSEEMHRLTSDPAAEAGTGWSPNGRWISFARALSGDRYELYIVPALGGVEKKVAEFRSPPTSLKHSWGPDSRWIIFTDVSGPDGSGYSLHYVSLDTYARHQLTAASKDLQIDIEPSVSPDGRRVAYVRLGSDHVGDLYLLELTEAQKASQEPTRLLNDVRPVHAPAWTADGKALILQLGGSLPSLAILRSGEERPERLVATGDRALMPSVAARGQRLAFVRGHWDTNIWEQRIDEGRPGSIVRWPCSSTYLDRQPRYSADGLKVAFVSDRSGVRSLWTCDADGSHPVHVSDLGPRPTGGLAWAPDGRSIIMGIGVTRRAFDVYNGTIQSSPPGVVSPDGRIVYYEDTSGRGGLWKIPFKGGEPTQLTADGAELRNGPVDERYLYYTRPVETASNISDRTMPSAMRSLWRVPVSGGAEEKLVDALSAPINFDVTEDGVYFIPAATPDGRTEIRYLPFTGNRTAKALTEIRLPVDWGFSVSPDRRAILFTQIDHPNADLMLVENFR